jgi:hypothetical protein
LNKRIVKDTDIYSTRVMHLRMCKFDR